MRRPYINPPAGTAGGRYLLWRTLRAMVRAGDSEGAHAVAISLGYTKRRNRKTLIEAIHQRIRREATAARDNGGPA